MLRTKSTALKKLLVILIAVVTLSVGVAAPTSVSADNPPPPPPVFTSCPKDFPDCGRDPASVPAADCKKTYPPKSNAYNDCVDKNNLFKKYVNPMIALLSLLVGLAVATGIIVGGIQYITSAGDPQGAASGKRHIRNAIIALLMYLFLYALLNWLIPGGVFS